MAETVVDLLEVVEIEKQHVDRGLRFAARAQHRRELLFEATAIGKFGDRVDARHPIDREGRVAPLGHVLDDDDDALPLHAMNGDFDRALVDGLEGNDEVALAAVVEERLPDAVDLGPRDDLVAHQLAQDRAQVCADLHVLVAQAEEVKNLVVRQGEAALGVDHHQPVRHVVERHVEPLGEHGRLRFAPR